MNSRHDARRRAVRTRSTYIIEAMVMLACVMAVVAVTMAIFSYAARIAAHAERQQQAIVLATNIAERFEADPESFLHSDCIMQQGEEGYHAQCDICVKQKSSGRMYSADISVSYGEEQLWVLETSRYVSEREGGVS